MPTFFNPTGGRGVDSTPYLRFLLVKFLVIDIFTIPFVRIPEILLALRISNKIWRFFWVSGVGGGCLTQSRPKIGRFRPQKYEISFFKVLMLIESSQMTNCGTYNVVRQHLALIWCKNSNF